MVYCWFPAVTSLLQC